MLDVTLDELQASAPFCPWTACLASSSFVSHFSETLTSCQTSRAEPQQPQMERDRELATPAKHAEMECVQTLHKDRYVCKLREIKRRKRKSTTALFTTTDVSFISMLVMSCM